MNMRIMTSNNFKEHHFQRNERLVQHMQRGVYTSVNAVDVAFIHN